MAQINSAGIALKTDLPFDQEGERRNPWWDDLSYRVLPNTVSTDDVNLYHQHIDPRPAQKDLNCLFPLSRLKELELLGEVGDSAERHYLIMGYILQPETLIRETTQKIIRDLRAEHADVVVMIPA